MMKAIAAVESNNMDPALAANLFRVPLADLTHMLSSGRNSDVIKNNVNKEEITLTESEEKQLLLYLMRLASMGFTVTLKQLRTSCSNILERRPNLSNFKGKVEASDAYTSDLFSHNEHFFFSHGSKVTLAAQVLSHYENLRRLYKQLDIAEKPHHMLFFRYTY